MFDVHEYSSRVLDNFVERGLAPGTTLTLEEVAGPEAAAYEVIRHFMASLHLVSICDQSGAIVADRPSWENACVCMSACAQRTQANSGNVLIGTDHGRMQLQLLSPVLRELAV